MGVGEEKWEVRWVEKQGERREGRKWEGRGGEGRRERGEASRAKWDFKVIKNIKNLYDQAMKFF